MVRVYLPLIAFAVGYVTEAQPPVAPGNATKGVCSPAVSGNNNTFTINCQGLSKEQSQEFLALLRKLTTNSLDAKVVMGMLDELVVSSREVKADVKDIRRKYDGRRISAANKRRLVQHLSGLPRYRVTIATPNSTPESTQFAEDVKEVFDAAGWNATIFNQMLIMTLPKGQDMFVKTGQNSTAGLIQRVFKEVGFEFVGNIDPQIEADHIFMRVLPTPILE